MERLAVEAKRCLVNAYSPYSGVKIGAALLDGDGRVFLGCNIENASYGLTVCAERVAVFNAVCNGSRVFRALCVAAEGDIRPVPCGACRQVLAEFAEDLEIFLVNTSGYSSTTTLRRLLPDAFRLRRG